MNRPWSGFLLLEAFLFELEAAAAATAPVIVFVSSVCLDDVSVLDISGSATAALCRVLLA